MFELYKIAIDEYRFEVKLNSDRMIHYVVANSALLAVGTGLLRLEGAHAVNVFVALVFAVGAFTSYLGIRAIRKGNEYYHRAIQKKTVIEDLLGLTAIVKEYSGATLAIGTTKGQTEIHRMLHDQGWLAAEQPKTGSIVYVAVLVLRLLLGMHFVGSVAALLSLLRTLPYIPGRENHIVWLDGFRLITSFRRLLACAAAPSL